MASIGSIASRPLRTERHGDKNAKSIAFLVLLWLTVVFAILCLAILLIDAFLEGSTRSTQRSSRTTRPKCSRSVPAHVLPSSARPWSS